TRIGGTSRSDRSDDRAGFAMSFSADMEASFMKSLAEASNCHWDVIVVGAGPAGGMTAYELARWGFRVLVVDKAEFPRWKVCGCCLNRRTTQILRSAGLDQLLAEAVRLREMSLHIGHNAVSFPLHENLVLSRIVLDNGLVEAARERGATFLSRTTARLG